MSEPVITTSPQNSSIILSISCDKQLLYLNTRPFYSDYELQQFEKNKKYIPPALTNMTISYAYEAFILDKLSHEYENAALETVQSNVLVSLSMKSGLIIYNRMAVNRQCVELFKRSVTSESNQISWGHFLGWKSVPNDIVVKEYNRRASYQVGCQSKRPINIPRKTRCIPVQSFLTLYVPFKLSLEPIIIQTQVLNHLKIEMGNNSQLTTKSIPSLSFIGLSLEKNNITGGDLRSNIAEFNVTDKITKKSDINLSDFGISFTSFLVLSSLLVLILSVYRMYEWRKKKRTKTHGNIQSEKGGESNNTSYDNDINNGYECKRFDNFTFLKEKELEDLEHKLSIYMPTQETKSLLNAGLVQCSNYSNTKKNYLVLTRALSESVEVLNVKVDDDSKTVIIGK